MSLFPWAKFRKRIKGALELHTFWRFTAAIPVFIAITPGAVHEVNLLDELTPEPGSFLVMDRGFVDFSGSTGCIRHSPSWLFAARTIWHFAVVIPIPTTALPECAAIKLLF